MAEGLLLLISDGAHEAHRLKLFLEKEFQIFEASGLTQAREVLLQSPVSAVVCSASTVEQWGLALYHQLRALGFLESCVFVLWGGLQNRSLGNDRSWQFPNYTQPQKVADQVSVLVNGSAPSVLSGFSQNQIEIRPTLVGNFEHFSPFDLVNLLIEAGKTGQLRIFATSSGGGMVFSDGRLTHVWYLDLQGELALLALFQFLEHNRDTEFAFEDIEDLGHLFLKDAPVTVSQPSNQVLLRVAFALGVANG
ncbi:MAG: DUF4388 domain-containing protein [Deinococcaceae bacterium]